MGVRFKFINRHLEYLDNHSHKYSNQNTIRIVYYLVIVLTEVNSISLLQIYMGT